MRSRDRRWKGGLIGVAMLLTACGGSPTATPTATPTSEEALLKELIAAEQAFVEPTVGRTSFALGETLTLPDGQTVTVLAAEIPVKGMTGEAPYGVDVKWCAGPHPDGGAVDANSFLFGTRWTDDTRTGSTFGEKEPSFTSATLRAGRCYRGWITLIYPFEHRQDKAIVLEFQDGLYEWKVK